MGWAPRLKGNLPRNKNEVRKLKKIKAKLTFIVGLNYF